MIITIINYLISGPKIFSVQNLKTIYLKVLKKWEKGEERKKLLSKLMKWIFHNLNEDQSQYRKNLLKYHHTIIPITHSYISVKENWMVLNSAQKNLWGQNLKGKKVSTTLKNKSIMFSKNNIIISKTSHDFLDDHNQTLTLQWCFI